MPAPRKVELLPPDVQAELNRRLERQAFSGYVALSEWLQAQGYSIGKSALQEHGSQLQRKLESIRATTKAMQLVSEAAPDDADLRSAATISLVQTDVFNVLVALQEAEEADPAERLKLLSRAAKSIAELSRASVNQKKWMVGVRDKAQAAAKTAETIARKGGLSENAVAQIRGAILGIPGAA